MPPTAMFETRSLLQEVLDHSTQPELRRLTILESDSQVTIRGRVSSFYMKSMALEAVKPLAVGRAILNSVEVED